MSKIKHFMWLLEQAFSGLIYYWPVTVALIILSVAAIIIALIKNERALLKNICFSFLPLLGTLLILISGSIFKQNKSFYFLPTIGAFLVLFLVILAIYRTKPLWYLSIPISVLILWTSFFAWLISAMSIVDDWM